MAITFNKKSWQSRVSEHPTRRRLTIVDQSLSYSLVDVAREEGNIEAIGDTFDKSTMDDMENRIENIAITAQAECDGLQTQIDNLPSLDETKRVDIGYKETAMNENGGSVKINPFEIYNGTLAYKTNATQAGSTYQAVGTGKNLLNPNGISGVTPTENGLEIIVNPPSNYNGNLFNGILPEGDYVIRDSVTGSNSTHMLGMYINGTISDYITNTAKSFHANGTDTYKFTLYVYTGNQDTIIRPQLESGSTPTSYEPYTGGAPAPTPTNPSAIVGIGTEQSDHTWSVTVGGVTASGLAYPLYEGDVLDFATGTVYRVNGYKKLNGSENWIQGSYSIRYFTLYISDMMSGNRMNGRCDYFKLTTEAFNVEVNNSIRFGWSNKYINICSDTFNDMSAFQTWLTSNNMKIVYPLATPTIERVTITGADAVIRGFIPSARFIEVGRKYMQEEFVTNHPTELNAYHKGYILQHGTTDKWISYEDSDGKVNSIWTQYGYDGQQQEFLESVAGEIYTATGSIPVEFKVSDIWMCGANGYSGTGMKSSPTREVNRLATNANGFPIELRPVNQTAVASLTMGSPVQFRITGTLWIVLEYDLLRDRETSRNDSNFYDFEDGVDTRDGVHYSKHYIDIDKGTTFNLSDETTLINYHFLQASVENPESLDYISFTVTDSNIAITGDDYATGIVLHIEHRKDGETESDLDTKEDIIINVT